MLKSLEKMGLEVNILILIQKWSHIFVAQKLGENGIGGDFYVILSS